MTPVEVGLLSVAMICLLIWGGMHIAIALTLCSLLGIWAINGNFAVAARLLGLAAADSIANYDLAVIPLFVLMGLLIAAADIGTDAFTAANQLLRRMAGGLGIATVLGNAVLSAVTGTTIASVAIFTRLAVPQMLRLGYKPRFAVGLVAGSGVLGMMIPPSLLIIVYCLITETSIAKMFIAALVPGLLLTLALCVGVVVMAWKWPSFAGRPVPLGEVDLMSTRQMVGSLVPLGSLLVLTFGGIYGGFFTATEAGAVGALGALVLALAHRKLSLRKFVTIVVETGSSASAILLLIIAANMYGRLIALSGLPEYFSKWLAAADLGFYALITCYLLLLLVLGTALDSISTVLLSVPLLLPTFVAHQVDLLWLGVITILATEMGIVTPPLGISAFVVKSTLNDPKITLNDIYKGSYPFLAIMLLTLVVLVAWPGLSTGLLKLRS